MIKKFNEFVEEGVFRSTVMHSTGKVVKNEDDPTPMIIAFMERHNITDYTINKDFTVDVEKSYIEIKEEDLIDGKLPFKFGTIGGQFNCSGNDLKSLEGCPEHVIGYFDCSSNKLSSLKDCPKEIGGGFNCSYNNLKSLEGCPENVGGVFDCSYNRLTSLEGCPKEVGVDFNCCNNKLTSLNGCPKEVGEFDCDYNNLTSLEGCPEKAGGFFDCSHNRLTSLEGCPKEVGSGFSCENNNKQFTEEEVRSFCDVKGKIYA